MREIKFSYIFQHEETGNIIDKRFTLEQIEEIDFGHYITFDLHRFALVSKRQFTGLKDKNDKEIYEGDIITNYGITNEMKARKYQIVFTDERARFSAYDLSSRWGTSISSYDMRQCEVIGNVYENPELLN